MNYAQELYIRKRSEGDEVIALAGNPNVGKSTVFNALTGLKQHTGNWPGKTVTNAQGYCSKNGHGFVFVDLPGCYSLLAHSEEEEAARDFICFGHPDAVAVVCDATCLERNLNLVLQVMETSERVVVCVNLMDEARKKQIKIHLLRLEKLLGVPVIGMTARDKVGLDEVFTRLDQIKFTNVKKYIPEYPKFVEEAINGLQPAVEAAVGEDKNARWICARLLEEDDNFLSSLERNLGYSILDDCRVKEALENIKNERLHNGYTQDQLKDSIAAAFINKAEEISKKVVTIENISYAKRDRKLDHLFTSKWTGIPVMFLMLLCVFWITISGANVPSKILSDGFFWIEDRLLAFAVATGIPEGIYAPVIFGVYRVLGWVVSVMLPPMAIFFPLFTLLEDLGYLPRVAFNLDKCFRKCCACGKQALTMCMGFGCNAAGVTGCRIIDSPRERLIAILTNNFVPCNGRFPTIIAVISIFFLGRAAGFFSSLLSAAFLAGVIIFGVFMTLLVSRLLSATILKGMPSSFILELPPYRKPQVGRVIIRSIFDRTLFVLGRAVAIAAPAGLVLWLMANLFVGDKTILSHCADFLNPLGRLMGLDGAILLAFILGFPANEIVMPIVIMIYMCQGNLADIEDVHVLGRLLVDNGWTWVTAVCTILFSLMHWPCGTTCLTIRKETGSWKWTAAAFLIPAVMGFIFCFLVSRVAVIFHWGLGG